MPPLTTTTNHASSIPSTIVGEAGKATKAVLQFTSGSLRGQEFVLDDVSTIGRKRGSTVCLPSDERRVSAEHAVLRRSPVGTWVLQEAGNKRGVLINGEPVPRGARPIVQSGDTITFGKGGPAAVLLLRSEEYRPEESTRYVIRLAKVGASERRFQFDCRPIVSIGRDRDSDIQLDPKADRGVSRRHARIRYAAGRFTIEDLGSELGTLVNGERVNAALLAEGDVIELGPAVPRLVVEALEGIGDAGPTEESVAAIARDVARRRSRGLLAWLLGAAVVVVVLGIFGWASLDHDTETLQGRVDSLQEQSDAAPPPTEDEKFRVLAARYEPALLLVYTRFTVKAPSVMGDATLMVGDTFGSGFLVSTGGYAVTNRHVLEPWHGDLSYAAELAGLTAEYGEANVVLDSETTVWPAGTRAFDDTGAIDPSTGFSTGATGGLQIVGAPPRFLVDAEHDGVMVRVLASNHADLALLRLQGHTLEPSQVPELAGEDVPLAPLDGVMSLGFPHGSRLLERGVARVSPTTGQVRKVEETLQLSIATYPGNSGGPLLAADGRVVGVTTRRHGEGLGVAIPAGKVLALIDHLDLRAEVLGHR